MSYYQQRNRSRLSIGQDGNTLTLLIAINLVVFVILSFIKVIYFFSFGAEQGLPAFSQDVLMWIALPAQFDVFLTRPWTLLTHMFVHDGVWHLIANMLWLWAFGYILQDLAGNSKLVPLFLYGGVAGAFLFVLANNVFPVPGGPTSKAPLGILPPSLVNLVGFLRKSTISLTSSLPSSII